MSMIEIARRRIEEISQLKKKGLSDAEVAMIMRSRGHDISSGSVSKVLRENNFEKEGSPEDPFREKSLEEIRLILESGSQNSRTLKMALIQILKILEKGVNEK